MKHASYGTIYMRAWRAKNKDKCSEYQKRYSKEYSAKHKDRLKRYIRGYMRDRYRSDPDFRLRMCLRARLRGAVKHLKKSKATLKLIGCSLEDFWIYLESKFESGMTRENYGQVWEIDHIIPCSIFDLSRIDHQKRCFHFSNLQPLTVSENRRKSNKFNK